MTDGQVVKYGDRLATTGQSNPCGGTADSLMVHFTVWKFSGNFRFTNEQEWSVTNNDIGGWTVIDGAQFYNGYFRRVRDGAEAGGNERGGRMLNEGILGTNTPYDPNGGGGGGGGGGGRRKRRFGIAGVVRVSSPARYDSRLSAIRPAGEALELSFLNPPSGATSAVFNITATGALAAGFVTAYPCGETRPTASNINVVVGQTVANLAVFGSRSAGKVACTPIPPCTLWLTNWVSTAPLDWATPPPDQPEWPTPATSKRARSPPASLCR